MVSSLSVSSPGASPYQANALLAQDKRQSGSSAKSGQLSEAEQKQVAELKRRDAEVRQHEQAHKAAAGALAKGGAKFDYVTGPDGKRYAVGGEVQIDTSTVANDPAASLRKAKAIKRAALAPKDPSGQDRRVAAEAAQMEAKAQKELAEQKKEQFQTYDSSGKSSRQNVASVLEVFA